MHFDNEHIPFLAMEHASTHSADLTLSGKPDVDLPPEAFDEQLNQDRKEDPYLVRFDVDDHANPKVISIYTHRKNCCNPMCYRRTGPE